MKYMALQSCVDPSTGFKLLKGQLVTFDVRLEFYPSMPDSCFQIITPTTKTHIPLTELVVEGFDAPFPVDFTF